MSDDDRPPDDDADVTVVRNAWPDGRPAVAIVEAIAAALACESSDVAPLFESVDPGALDDLLRTGDDLHIAFVHAGVEVDAWSDGTVAVELR